MKFVQLLKHFVLLPKYIIDGTLLTRLKFRYFYYIQEIRKYRQVKRNLAWEKMSVSGKPVEMKLPNKLKIRLYPDSQLSRMIYAYDFELNERLFVQRFLRRGDVFVDVGANIGLYTIIASKKVGLLGMVYSFEPVPQIFNRLQENVALNNLSNVVCFPIALSSTSEYVEMHMSTNGYDAWNSFAGSKPESDMILEKVECMTFDNFLLTKDVMKVDMMKIDVEGWEENVIHGAEMALSDPNAPILIVEFNDRNALASGSSCQTLYKKLLSFGYKMYTYDMWQNQLIPDPVRQEYPFLNLIAVKKIDLVQERLL